MEEQSSAKQKMEQELEFSQQQQQQHAEGNAARIADLQQQINQVGNRHFWLSILFEILCMPQEIQCTVVSVYLKCVSTFLKTYD